MTAVTDDRALRMQRRFDASPERLFDAWTDPHLAAAWLFTTPGSESHHAALDVRVGGKWEITDRRDGADYRALGEYLEVERPGRLELIIAVHRAVEDERLGIVGPGERVIPGEVDDAPALVDLVPDCPGRPEADRAGLRAAGAVAFDADVQDAVADFGALHGLDGSRAG